MAILYLTACASFQGAERVVVIRITSGDTLQAIASHYQVSPAVIMQHNGMRRPQDLTVGSIIEVPLPANGVDSPSYFLNTNQKISWPVRGDISSDFGARHGRAHEGIDIRANKGTKIGAAHDGVVVRAGWSRGYGLTVVIQSRGYKTLYAHCSKLFVKPGQKIQRGDAIAAVGRTGDATGYHLHFEYRDVNNRPYDPLLFLDGPPTLFSAR